MLNATSKSRLGVEILCAEILDELRPELLWSPAAMLRIESDLCLVIGGESLPSEKPLRPLP